MGFVIDLRGYVCAPFLVIDESNWSVKHALGICRGSAPYHRDVGLRLRQNLAVRQNEGSLQWQKVAVKMLAIAMVVSFFMVYSLGQQVG